MMADKKIRVLHILEGLGSGGVEKRLLYDLQKMNKDAFQNYIAYLYEIDGLTQEFEKLGILIYPLRMKSIYNFPKALLSLLSIIKKNQIQIIHTQLFGANIYGRICGKLAGVDAILSTFQCTDYEPDDTSLYSFKRKIIEKITGKLCNDAFIAVSNAVLNSTQKRLGFNNITVIPNSLNLEYYDNLFFDDFSISRLRQELGIDTDEKILLNIGRLSIQKGQVSLIRAMPWVLSRSKRKVKLIIVGDGPLLNELKEESCRLKINNHVLFLGNRNDVASIIILSDIFIMPSLSEGLSMALLEAMYLKKICLVSRIRPMLELVEDGKTGFLINHQDPEDIALKVLNILDSEEDFIELRENAKNVVAQRYNTAINIKSLESLYRRLINKDVAD